MKRAAPTRAPAPAGSPDGPTTLAARVRAATGLSWQKARTLIERGKADVDGVVIRDPAARVGDEAEVALHLERPRPSAGVLSPSRILYADRDVVVVDKPAGVMTVPFDAGDRDTLDALTRAALRRMAPPGERYDPEVGAVQRLDKPTTGVLVFARTVAAKKHLSAQLREHSVERVYLAIAHGACQTATHDTLLLADRGDGLRGSYGHFRRPKGPAPKDARRAVTHVEALAPLADASLVVCRLETGRQHQIRIHLSEAGNPLVGEAVYIRRFPGRRIEAPRPMLHARVLGFVHPRTEAPMRFVSELPEDFAATLRRLGGEGVELPA